MFFTIIPIKPLQIYSELDNKDILVKSAFAITLSPTEISEQSAFLYALKNKHCFHIDLSDFSSQNQEQVELFFKNLAPLFFNTCYIKLVREPLILISIDNDEIKNPITLLFNKIISEQGFNGISILFIKKSLPDNFSESNPNAYYSNNLSITQNSIDANKMKHLLLSGALIGKYLFVNDKIETIDTIRNFVDDILNSNEDVAQLLQLHYNLLKRNTFLEEHFVLDKQQLENTQVALGLTKESFNHDLQWYKSETKKIKDWSTEEIRKVKEEIRKINEWYYLQYDILPKWYKKLGKLLLRFTKPSKGGEK